MVGFIGIHTGAGLYKESNYERYKSLIKSACQQAHNILSSGGTALSACCAAVKVLEDDPLVNAGYGSNLTRTGIVECDACIMDGSKSHFGAVGAVSGVKNPIELAQYICQQQSSECELGLVHPYLLVGEGARLFANEVGIKTVPNYSMISSRSMKQYEYYKKHLDRFNAYKLRKSMAETGNLVVKINHRKRTKNGTDDVIVSYSKRKCNNNNKDSPKTDDSSETSDNSSAETNVRVVINERNSSDNIKKQSESTEIVLNSSGTISKRLDKDSSNTDELLETTNSSLNETNDSIVTNEHNSSDAMDKLSSESNEILLINKCGETKLNGSSETDFKRFDTVGAVCMDDNGCLVAACSSGGIVLKRPGRIGQSAIAGAGVWATDNIAVSTTGCGEHLIHTQLAREITSGFEQSTNLNLNLIIQEKYLESTLLKNNSSEKVAGAIAITLNEDKSMANFVWSHTSYSMGIGFMTTNDSEPKCFISNDHNVNKSFTVDLKK